MKLTIYIVILMYCILSCKAGETTITRKLETEFLSPGSANASIANITLAYTKATGPRDTLHYVFSTLGAPTVLVAKTSLKANLTVDWKKLMDRGAMSDSVNFTENASYAYALIFDQLIEYNDTDDKADPTQYTSNSTSWLPHSLVDLPWEDFANQSDAKNNIIAFVLTKNHSDFSFKKDGSLSIKFKVTGDDARSLDLPHLEYTANTTEFDLEINKMTPRYAASRFVLQMEMVTTEPVDRKANLFTKKSSDDEYTPGAFELIYWTTEGSEDDMQTSGAFLQWKPVCYVRDSHKLADSTGVKKFSLVTPNMTETGKGHGLARAYFGDDLYQNKVNVKATNISFGRQEDKFYTLTNYTLWTATLGYGAPPTDEVSGLILVIIIVGLGVPVLFIIFGGIFLCVRKRRSRTRGGYEEISSINT